MFSKLWIIYPRYTFVRLFANLVNARTPIMSVMQQ